MKMSDVFALPIIDAEVDNNDHWDDEQYEAAAHAINQHDALVEALIDIILCALRMVRFGTEAMK